MDFNKKSTENRTVIDKNNVTKYHYFIGNNFFKKISKNQYGLIGKVCFFTPVIFFCVQPFGRANIFNILSEKNTFWNFFQI